MKSFAVVVAGAGSLTLADLADAASSIQSFSPATNDRFANDPSFVGSGFDFSGVGRDNSGRWAVMLTPTVFISANHYAPSGSLTFYPGNNPSATPTVAAIATGQQIGSTDFYIGRLDTRLPSAITSYSYVTTPLNSLNFASSAVVNARVFMGGISPTTTGYGTATPDVTDYAIGTNRIEGFIANLSLSPTTSVDAVYTIRNLASDSAFGYSYTTFEAQLASGDSGSPLFFISGGNLAVCGVALGISSGDIDPGDGSALRDFTAFSYTGNYASQIASYIATSPIPEPSTATLLALAGLAGVMTRRKVGSQITG